MEIRPQKREDFLMLGCCERDRAVGGTGVGAFRVDCGGKVAQAEFEPELHHALIPGGVESVLAKRGGRVGAGGPDVTTKCR